MLAMLTGSAWLLSCQTLLNTMKPLTSGESLSSKSCTAASPVQLHPCAMMTLCFPPKKKQKKTQTNPTLIPLSGKTIYFLIFVIKI